MLEVLEVEFVLPYGPRVSAGTSLSIWRLEDLGQV